MLVNDSPFTRRRQVPSVSDNVLTGLCRRLNIDPRVDPFMSDHPPITFSAYALMVVPFTVGVTHFVAKLRGTESMFDDWLGSMTRWLRGSWLLLTAAITLGGIWAYRVLGWGGFWSWDPVETSVLIPWLGRPPCCIRSTVPALRPVRSTAPAATAALLPLVIYATAVVRSGVFRSVHSFAGGGIGSGVLFLLGTTSTLAVGPAFIHWFRLAWRRRRSEPARPGASTTLPCSGSSCFVRLALGPHVPRGSQPASGVEVSVDARYYFRGSFPVVVGMLLAGGMYAQQSASVRERQS